MAEESDIIEEKQNYLRKNILDQGYDEAIFIEYLLKLKGEEGLDIKNWSKNDLIKVVQDFKNHERNVNLKKKIKIQLIIIINQAIVKLKKIIIIEKKTMKMKTNLMKKIKMK